MKEIVLITRWSARHDMTGFYDFPFKFADSVDEAERFLNSKGYVKNRSGEYRHPEKSGLDDYFTWDYIGHVTEK